MSKLSVLSAVAVLAAATSGAAQATAVFTPTNNPQPGEENILFGSPPQSGTTLAGTVNQSGIGVQFTSTQSLTTSGQGQAFLEATAPATTITGAVTFTVPGGTFLDYIFNPQVGGPDASGGPATITAITNDGTFTQDITLGNGNNFWTITTTGGEVLTAVTLTPAVGTSYAQYQQPRVSGAAIIPEPATLALLGSALAGLGLMRRRRRV